MSGEARGDAEGHGVVFCAMLPRATYLSRVTRSRWQRVAVHLAAAHRVRRRLAEPVVDAVLEPGGRVAHAEAGAGSRSARERLREACLARERARTRRVRALPDEALGLWQALVAGRWSLVDRFDSDGRRYVVARRNEPAAVGPLALTPRERQVVAHLVQGDSSKVIAYALGVAPSTVSETARSALLKLGVRTVAELVRVYRAMNAP